MIDMPPKTKQFAFLASQILATLSISAYAQTTVSMNLDYAEGKYGEQTTSTTWTLPLIVKHQAGPLTAKFNLAYVRATGTAAAGGDRFSNSRQVQQGMGDLITTLTYDIYTDPDSGLSIDLGGKAKLAVGDRHKDLITTGKHDYSVLVDLLQSIHDWNVYGTLGWTKKGDPEGVDYRNPWFSSVGVSRKFAEVWSAGVFYDYRQKVTRSGDPVSEATLFVERQLPNQMKLQGYLVCGFSDASPDLGAGLTVSVRF